MLDDLYQPDEERRDFGNYYPDELEFIEEEERRKLNEEWEEEIKKIKKEEWVKKSVMESGIECEVALAHTFGEMYAVFGLMYNKEINETMIIFENLDKSEKDLNVKYENYWIKGDVEKGKKVIEEVIRKFDSIKNIKALDIDKYLIELEGKDKNINNEGREVETKEIKENEWIKKSEMESGFKCEEELMHTFGKVYAAFGLKYSKEINKTEIIFDYIDKSGKEDLDEYEKYWIIGDVEKGKKVVEELIRRFDNFKNIKALDINKYLEELENKDRNTNNEYKKENNEGKKKKNEWMETSDVSPEHEGHIGKYREMYLEGRDTPYFLVVYPNGKESNEGTIQFYLDYNHLFDQKPNFSADYKIKEGKNIYDMVDKIGGKYEGKNLYFSDLKNEFKLNMGNMFGKINALKENIDREINDFKFNHNFKDEEIVEYVYKNNKEKIYPLSCFKVEKREIWEDKKNEKIKITDMEDITNYVKLDKLNRKYKEGKIGEKEETEDFRIRKVLFTEGIGKKEVIEYAKKNKENNKYESNMYHISNVMGANEKSIMNFLDEYEREKLNKKEKVIKENKVEKKEEKRKFKM